MDCRFLRFPGGASTAPTTGNEPDIQILMRLPWTFISIEMSIFFLKWARIRVKFPFAATTRLTKKRSFNYDDRKKKN